MRVGIIGCGGIAGLHVQAYRACDGVEVAAGADVDIDRAASIAGREHAYTDYREMLAKENLDAVSVCTPPKFHKEAVCTALEAGTHVLCEKPLGYDAADAREMVDCAKKTSRLLVTAFCHRFHEPILRAREMISAGRIGIVTMFRNRFGGPADMTAKWFSDPEVSGGGTLLDTSIHSIDLFRYLVGDPVRVAAAVNTANKAYRVEDCNAILLQTEQGAIGSIEASWTSPGSMNIIEIYGTEGSIVIDYSKSSLRLYLASTGKWEEIENSAADRFLAQARHFVDCVRNGSKPIVDGTDGLRANEIVDACYAFNKADGCGWARV